MYELANYDPAAGWAKLPARTRYRDDRIIAFHDCHLRNPTELEALKLFYLFIARRDRSTNVANISYDKITEFAGVPRQRIKPAISWLINHSLVNVESVRSFDGPLNRANVYRIVGIEPFNHRGTRGRMDDTDPTPPAESISVPNETSARGPTDDFESPF
jgi:hypothetical protein